jgi:hypothetical protein
MKNRIPNKFPGHSNPPPPPIPPPDRIIKEGETPLPPPLGKEVIISRDYYDILERVFNTSCACANSKGAWKKWRCIFIFKYQDYLP